MAVLEASSPVPVSERARRRPLVLGSPMATAGLLIVAVILLAGILAPLLAPYAPDAAAAPPP